MSIRDWWGWDAFLAWEEDYQKRTGKKGLYKVFLIAFAIVACSAYLEITKPLYYMEHRLRPTIAAGVYIFSWLFPLLAYREMRRFKVPKDD